MKLFLRTALFCLAASAAAFAHANDALSTFKQFIAQQSFLSGQFIQNYSQSGKAGRAQSGNFALSRPNSFRWEMTKPFNQLLISNGQTLTLWDADLNQATQRSAKGLLENTPAALLLGNAEVFNQFTFANAGEKDGLDWLTATPKNKDGQFAKIEIAFSGKAPAKLVITDAFGGVSSVTLSSLELGKTPAPSSFQFTLPKGADLIKQ